MTSVKTEWKVMPTIGSLELVRAISSSGTPTPLPEASNSRRALPPLGQQRQGVLEVIPNQRWRLHGKGCLA